jgi:hypothetical protein
MELDFTLEIQAARSKSGLIGLELFDRCRETSQSDPGGWRLACIGRFPRGDVLAGHAYDAVAKRQYRARVSVIFLNSSLADTTADLGGRLLSITPERATAPKKHRSPFVGIDTPGMREFHIWIASEGSKQIFPEIDALSVRCHFRDCTHTVE